MRSTGLLGRFVTSVITFALLGGLSGANKSQNTENSKETDYLGTLEVESSNMTVKALSNYTFVMDIGNKAIDFQKLNPVIKVTFSPEFQFWLRIGLQIQDEAAKTIVTEAKLVDRSIYFDFNKLTAVGLGKYRFSVLEVANPSTLILSHMPMVTLLNENETLVELRDTATPRYLNRLNRIAVENRHTEFIPGFYTSPFKFKQDAYFAYSVKVRIMSDSKYINPDPEFVELRPERLTLNLDKLQPLENYSPQFRLRISKDTPPGNYFIKFEVIEDNPIENFAKIEMIGFAVGYPESNLSKTKPRPFNGPIPEIKFSQRTYQAALGGFSPLRYVSLTPSATDDFTFEIRTMLPTQPDKISILPPKMTMPAGSGKSMFYFKPLVGSVSGNLYLHVGDLHYKLNTVIREKKANLDVVHNEVDGDQVKVLVDGSSARNINFLPFSSESLQIIAGNTTGHQMQVEGQIKVVINHPVMVMQLFLKNISMIAHDKLLGLKLKDITPLDNNSLIELGGQAAVYVGFSEYDDEVKSYSLSLDTNRRAFLPYMEHSILTLFVDCTGSLHVSDTFFRKSVSSSLRLYKLTLTAPSQLTHNQVSNYLSTFTSLRDRIVMSKTPAQPQVTSLGVDSDGHLPMARYNFLHISNYELDKLNQILTSTLLGEKSQRALRYYIYKENGLVFNQGGLLSLHNISEVSFQNLKLSVTIEDMSESMLHYSLHLDPGELAEFKGDLDFTAVMKLHRKQSEYSASSAQSLVLNPPDSHDRATSLAIFNKESLSLDTRFTNLFKNQDYALEARTCLVFKNTISCDPRTVDYSLFSISQKR